MGVMRPPENGKAEFYICKMSGVTVKSLQEKKHSRKVQTPENLLKYINGVIVLRYFPPLVECWQF